MENSFFSASFRYRLRVIGIRLMFNRYPLHECKQQSYGFRLNGIE